MVFMVLPGKIEISGTKMLPDGTTARVVWQVQGNNELGLPTEQDLDIFVALGVLTFRNDFAKTVTFTGREIARILDIGAVHGKFYKRLKLAMDRFIPLRFRALMENELHEEVKWCNVFQEASFSLNRSTGRCTGSVTWTDKLIEPAQVFVAINADVGACIRAVESYSGSGLLPGSFQRRLADRAAPASRVCV